MFKHTQGQAARGLILGIIFLLSCLDFCSGAAATQHVVLITIDGGAAYQLDNPELVLPNIRKMIAEGAWADQGSETVFPSVTHPSHSTIITGMLPMKHGDLANELFDRKRDRSDPPNSLLHAEVVKVKTLFDSAKAQHLVTASIFWPETVLDPAIDYNLMLRTTGKKHAVIENAWTNELRSDGVPIDVYTEALNGEVSTELFDPLIRWRSVMSSRSTSPT